MPLPDSCEQPRYSLGGFIAIYTSRERRYIGSHGFCCSVMGRRGIAAAGHRIIDSRCGLSAAGVFDVTYTCESIGNSLMLLVPGGYALAEAVEVNGVDRWLMRRILSMAGSQSIGLLVALTVTSALLSMLISSTATTALLCSGMAL